MKERRTQKLRENSFEKQVEEVMTRILFEEVICSHVETVLSFCGDSLPITNEEIDDSFYVLTQSDKLKRDRYIQWVSENPGKTAPQEIAYSPSPKYAIKEDIDFIRIALFDEQAYTGMVKIGTAFYYGLMADETKEKLINLSLHIQE